MANTVCVVDRKGEEVFVFFSNQAISANLIQDATVRSSSWNPVQFVKFCSDRQINLDLSHEELRTLHQWVNRSVAVSVGKNESTRGMTK